MPTIKGTGRDDRITGPSELGSSNELSGLKGDDFLVGGFLSTNAIWGGSGDDTLESGSSADLLYGGPGRDLLRAYFGGGSRLFGGPGDDVLEGNGRTGCLLDGGRGSDTLVGGRGADTYIVDSPDDVIVEAFHQKGKSRPRDKVVSSIDFVLPDGLEDLELSGRKNLHGSGNQDGNRLEGNAGKNLLDGKGGRDTLCGGLGRDTLMGGSGSDVFLFDTAPRRSNIDRIVDFKPRTDKIHLLGSVFDGIGETGILPKAAFHVGPHALSGSERVIYDRVKGILYYDPDGDGVAVQFPIARISEKAKLTHHDVIIV